MLTLLLLIACPAQEQAAPVEDKCPHVDMERMEGRWIKVRGEAPDHTVRLQVLKNPEGRLEAWFVNGDFNKRRMTVERRTDDFLLDEVLPADRQARYAAGQDTKLRIYLQPWKQRCSIRAVEARVAMVDGKEKEQQTGGAGYQEYLQMPEKYAFTYRPCDEPLFLADAATSWAKASAELSGAGAAATTASLGEKLPVAAFSDAAADGDAACTFTFDAYFDDQAVADKANQPAGEVVDGKRRWGLEWFAPYSGNHMFELYRYRQCGGGERELIAVACNNAVLTP